MVRLGELLETTVPPLGFELVDWDIAKSRLLRVFIDAPKGVSVDDCARVSHHLTRLFAVENIEYDRLEVSSPGLDRSLGKLADYTRFVGEEAQVHLRELTEGTRRLKGILRGTEGQSVLLETATGTRAIPFDTIDRCRLIPNIEWRKA
ncbi:MAG: ribosome maturation factor RimP [Betaproteobacteria bacterium]|nr:ribosome maturation factor RimP [Betaproteobacteria bacterium]